MNLSSVLIVAKVQHIDELKRNLKNSFMFNRALWEWKNHRCDRKWKFRKRAWVLQNAWKITSYYQYKYGFSYQDLDKDIQKAINSGAIQTIEKNENAENIRYYGSIYNQMSWLKLLDGFFNSFAYYYSYYFWYWLFVF